MTKLLGDRRIVGVLGLMACALMYQRIVVPLLPDPAMTADYDMPVDDVDDTGAIDELTPQVQLATAQYDLRNIDIGALVFNENPSRDPFMHRQEVVAPLAEVVVTAPDTPASTAVLPRRRLPRLTAIAFADSDRAAVLDNRIVRAGERVDAFQVAAIARRKVTLRAVDNQQTYTLTLTP
ncbi:MAG: hypothetical protein AAGD86_03175 [Pseudomonadota bacterium]